MKKMLIFLTLMFFAGSIIAAPCDLMQFGESNVIYGKKIMDKIDHTRDVVLIDQQPNQSNGIFSDASCDICGSGTQVIADDFTLDFGFTINQIVLWTGYYPGNVPPATDVFTVIFHNDAGGIPGTTISTELTVPYVRVQTGMILFGVDEWMHTLTLASPVALSAGTYWVEIYNDTGFATDDMFWEVGNLDPFHGIAGSAWDTTAPGSAWIWDGASDLAFQLISTGGVQNDFCEYATPVGEVTDYPFDTTTATTSGAGGHNINQDLWFVFTAPEDGTIDVVDLCGSSFDTKLAVWDECGGLELDYNDDDCGMQSAVYNIPADDGEDYYIQVGGYGGSDYGPGDLTIIFTGGGPPEGSDCTNPITVTLPAALPYTDSNTTCGMINDYFDTCLGYYDGGEDIIYEVTVTSDVTVDITLDPLATTYTGICIDLACPPGVSCIDYSTNYSASPHGMTGVPLTVAESPYYIMIDTWPSPDCIPDFDLIITEAAPPPPNDDCADAQYVDLSSVDTQTLAGTTIGATVDCPGVLDWNAVWYEVYLPYAYNNLTVDYCGSDPVLVTVGVVYFWDCSCSGYVLYDDNVWDACSGYPTDTNPTTYYNNIPGPVSIFYPAFTGPSRTGQQQDFTITLPSRPGQQQDFTITFTNTEAAGPPPNDDCANAEPVGEVTDYPFDTTTATTSGDGTHSINQDLWYVYTATGDGIINVDLCGSTFDTKLAIWAECGGPELDYNDDSAYCNRSLQSAILDLPVVNGEDYYIQVGGYGSNSGTGDLTIVEITCLPPTALYADNITQTSADLYWTESGSATIWNVEVGAPGFTPGTGAELIAYYGATTIPQPVTGLTSATIYDFYVQADCVTRDLSDWAGPGTFSTTCDVITTFPWTEGFEDSWVGSPPAPPCWAVIDNNSDGDMWYQYSSYPHSGSYCAALYTDYNSNNDDWLITPQLDLSARTNYRLTFWVRAQSTYEADELQVLLSTTNSQISSFTEVIMPSTVINFTSYQQFFVDLSSYTGQVYIAFVRNQPPGDGWRLRLDDIVVEVPPTPIYDIQYTTDPSGDSPLDGEIVTTVGVVFANDWIYPGGHYFICDPATRGWEWNGIFVYDNTNSPNVGDMIMITGEVDEYYGFTELKSISSYEVLSTDNPIPDPVVLTTGGVNQEMYESTLARVYDATVTQDVNDYGEWYVDDGIVRAECQIDDGFADYDSDDSETNVGTNYYSITGVIDYAFGEFGLNPGNQCDLMIPNVIPYYENFEAGDGCYTHSGTNDCWEWGIPTDVGTYPGPTSAFSGVNVWGTDLDSDYLANTLCYLYTSIFDLTTSASELYISFMYWYEIESWDGVNLSINILGDRDWVLLDPVSPAGYPDNSVQGLGGDPGFNGIHEFWEKAKFNISDYIGETVQFRFVFGSDGSGQRSGWYMDDIKISEPVPELIMEPNSVDFGEWQVGQTGSSIVTIWNDPDAPVDLEISSITASSPYFTMAPLGTMRTFYIPPGGSMDFEVTFSPIELIEYDEYFTIISNDPFTMPPFADGAVLNVTGTGVEPFSILGPLPPFVDMFVDADGYKEELIEVTNEGVLPLDINDIALETRVFDVSPGEIIGVPYLGTDEITVSYTAGADNAIESNAVTFTTNEPPLPAGEYFDGAFPPDGWAIEGGTNWQQSFTNNAGGQSPEAMFNWIPSTTAVQRLISLPINTTGMSTVELEFKHMVNDYNGNYFLRIETTSDGINWNVASTIPSVYLPATTEYLSISTPDVGSATFQIAWVFDGYSFNINYWYVDDAMILNLRSLAEPVIPSYNVPVTAYVVEPFDVYEDSTTYRCVNSVVPGARDTDYPEYEWFDNVASENLWDWETDPTYFLDHSFNYLGMDITNIEMNILDYYGTLYSKASILMNPVANRLKPIPEISESEPLKPVNCIDIFDEENADRIDADNSVMMASNLGMRWSEYVSSEEFGTVITWYHPGFFVGQIILYKSGDIEFNYNEINTGHGYFNSPAPGIGIRGDTDHELLYEDLTWVYSNVKPEMAIRFYPQYDDTALLPSPITWNEDNVYYMNVAELIPTGGEILTIIMTDSDHISTVVDGNNIEFHPELNFFDVAGENIGYDISYVVRGREIRSTGTILAIVMPVNDPPIVIDPLDDMPLLEDFSPPPVVIPLSGVFYDVDSELNYSVIVDDETKVNAEIVGEDLVLTSIQDAFTTTPILITVTATEVVRGRAAPELQSKSDNTRDFVSSAFYLTIDPVNDTPIVQNPIPDTQIDEDNDAVIDISDVFFDVDGDPLTYDFALEIGTHLTASIDPGTLIFTITPEANWSGIETVLVIADDGVSRQLSVNKNVKSRASVQDEFVLTVLPVNDVPFVANPIGPINFDEDTVHTGIDLNNVFDDVDIPFGDVLTFSVQGENHLTVDIVAGAVTITPEPDWNGIEVLTFVATDQELATAEDIVTVTVDPVNDAPTINLPDVFEFYEGGSLISNFALYVNDIDGDPLTLTVEGDTFVTVDINGLTVTFSTVDPLDYGEEELVFTVDDGVGGRDTASDTCTVIVYYVNHPPEYSDEAPTYVNRDEDFTPAYVIGDMDDMFFDIDPPEYTDLTFDIVSFNADEINAYIDVDNNLIIESVLDANGYSNLIIQCNDNDSYYGFRDGLITEQLITIHINPINDPPELFDIPEEIVMASNTIIYLNLEDNWSDVDDENPVMDIISPEDFVEVTKVEGYDYRFRINSAGLSGAEDTITVVLDDGHDRDVATADIFVIITASDPPYIIYYIPNQEFDEDFELTEIIDLDDCFGDPEDDELAYAVEVLTEEGGIPVIDAQIDVDNILYLGSNILDWNGTAEIRIDCWDLYERITISQFVTVYVLPVNDLPVAGEIADVTLDEDFGSYFVVDLTTVFTDVDGDELIYQVLFDPGEITVEIDGTELWLFSIPDEHGLSAVIVRAHDSSANPIPWINTSFNVTVQNVYDFPTFMPGLDGMVIPVALEGELLNFEDLYGVDYIDNHNEDNTIPITFVLLGDIPYYEVTVPELLLFGINVLPIGHQWAYPNQDCELTIEGGDQVTVTLMTNFSPYILQELPDLVLNFGDFHFIDMDLYFDDPEGGGLSFNFFYDDDYLDLVFDDFINMLSMEIVTPTYNIETTVTVIASDEAARASACQSFNIVINPCLFISEYIEGSGYNKALELYNPLSIDLDLSDFAIVRYNNGSTTSEHLYNMTGILNSNDVYVVAQSHSGVAPEILAVADDLSWIPTNYNGDDYIGLLKDWNNDDVFDRAPEEIDVIGVFGYDPGSYYAVGDTSDGTRNHTLVRKDYINGGNTDWYASAGTNNEDSEWIVYPINTFDYLGYHDTDFMVVMREGDQQQIVFETRDEQPESDDVQPNYVTALGRNHPNPFNPVTNISYSLEESMPVDIVIYNIRGQLIKHLLSDTKSAGAHQVAWDGRDDFGKNVASGIYFYRMTAGSYHNMHKMILMK